MTSVAHLENQRRCHMVFKYLSEQKKTSKCLRLRKEGDGEGGPGAVMLFLIFIGHICVDFI